MAVKIFSWNSLWLGVTIQYATKRDQMSDVV